MIGCGRHCPYPEECASLGAKRSGTAEVSAFVSVGRCVSMRAEAFLVHKLLPMDRHSCKFTYTNGRTSGKATEMSMKGDSPECEFCCSIAGALKARSDATAFMAGHV